MQTNHVDWFSVLFCLCTTLIIEGNPIDLYPQSKITAGPTYGSYRFNILQHLSGISPYFESNDNELSPTPPQGCRVSKATYLVRHGSIHANDYDFNYTIQPFLAYLKNVSTKVDFSKSKDLAFLSRWASPITDSVEQVEKLTKSGAMEAFDLGTQLAYRYPNLISTKKNLSVFKVWFSNSTRTQLSASMLALGLRGGEKSNNQLISVSEEKDRGANTLTPKEACPRFKGSWGSKQAETWLKTYSTPIIQRLNTNHPALHFSATNILAMQELCGYETVIRGSSAFCDLFAPEDWLAFEYYFDIKYYYELSYGNDLSPSLGMPWVMASSQLLHRTNSEDQDLYISVAHREMPPFILTALGLYNDSSAGSPANSTFPLDHINDHRVWKSSEFIPFLGRVALERLECGSTAFNGSFVRVLVNSAPKPLPGCRSGPGFSCPLEQYMKYIISRNGTFAEFSKACEIPHNNASNLLNIYF